MAVLGGLLGVLASVLGGMSAGLLFGGIVAMAGMIPAGYGAWLGIQEETQAKLAYSLGMLVLCFGVGALLIILWAFNLVSAAVS